MLVTSGVDCKKELIFHHWLVVSRVTLNNSEPNLMCSARTLFSFSFVTVTSVTENLAQVLMRVASHKM